MIRKLDVKNMDTAKQVLDLQMASYIIEAKLIDFYDIPPLKDDVENLRVCDEIFFGYFEAGEIIGLISLKHINNIIDIHRVAVYPEHFRKGIAQNLLTFIENLDISKQKIIVSTGKNNFPAVNLYLKNGYEITGETEIAKGIFILNFEKEINRNPAL
ncbi:MAG: GNAT family N-acetyltransferase [Saprospiraceae bacterium]|nr:GNAT family N-acetyltransferase [Saprospiraceae bacterium]